MCMRSVLLTFTQPCTCCQRSQLLFSDKPTSCRVKMTPSYRRVDMHPRLLHCASTTSISACSVNQSHNLTALHMCSAAWFKTSNSDIADIVWLGPCAESQKRTKGIKLDHTPRYCMVTTSNIIVNHTRLEACPRFIASVQLEISPVLLLCLLIQHTAYVGKRAALYDRSADVILKPRSIPTSSEITSESIVLKVKGKDNI
jgi:hypothetical protein